MALRQRQLCLSRSYFCSVCSNDSTLRVYLWSWKSMAIMAPLSKWPEFRWWSFRIFKTNHIVGYTHQLYNNANMPWSLPMNRCMKSHEIHWNPMSSGQPMLNQHVWWLSFSNEFGLFMAFPHLWIRTFPTPHKFWRSGQVPAPALLARVPGTRANKTLVVGLKMDGAHQIGQLDPLNRKIWKNED